MLIVLYDDTGLAAWSPYGGGIEMPTMQRLADEGLTYSQWHTTALCSPTRSCFLTGRNHHTNGFACITEGALGYPGAHARLPESCTPFAKILQRNGWNTYWIGKDHNVPSEECHAGAPKRGWPLSQGFDRFYGFLGGETNQWYPTLVEDNKFVEQPAPPEDGYHLSKDLADQALTMLRDTRQSRRRGRGSCGSARAPTTRPTTRRRSTSTGTRASSTTATRPTASGSCRGWSSAGSCPRAPT